MTTETNAEEPLDEPLRGIVYGEEVLAGGKKILFIDPEQVGKLGALQLRAMCSELGTRDLIFDQRERHCVSVRADDGQETDLEESLHVHVRDIPMTKGTFILSGQKLPTMPQVLKKTAKLVEDIEMIIKNILDHIPDAAKREQCQQYLASQTAEAESHMRLDYYDFKQPPFADQLFSQNGGMTAQGKCYVVENLRREANSPFTRSPSRGHTLHEITHSFVKPPHGSSASTREKLARYALSDEQQASLANTEKDKEAKLTKLLEELEEEVMDHVFHSLRIKMADITYSFRKPELLEALMLCFFGGQEFEMPETAEVRNTRQETRDFTAENLEQ